MSDKKLSVINGDREAYEVEKAQEILQALLVENNREAAFKIAEELAPRGALAIAGGKQQKTTK